MVPVGVPDGPESHCGDVDHLPAADGFGSSRGLMLGVVLMPDAAAGSMNTPHARGPLPTSIAVIGIDVPTSITVTVFWCRSSPRKRGRRLDRS
jgi:hypothetical protein